LSQENFSALEAGFANLERHARNLREVFGLPVVVAINRFPADTAAELDLVREKCGALHLPVALSEVWAKGGAGGVELAELVAAQAGGPLNYCYELDQPVEDKILSIVRKLYGGARVDLSPEAKKQAKKLTELGFGNLPVCMAKTQYSFSDKPNLLGAPEGFEVSVKQLKVSAGAGFIVALTGDIMTMPGLPKSPAAERIDVDEDGRITGLF
jgi:formate--tetrahydrofolate ligase